MGTSLFSALGNSYALLKHVLVTLFKRRDAIVTDTYEQLVEPDVDQQVGGGPAHAARVQVDVTVRIEWQGERDERHG